VTLESALGDAISGNGRIVMLVGEPVVGKIRTSQKIADSAQQQGPASCGAAAMRVPVLRLLAGVQAVRSYIADQDSDSIRDIMGSGVGNIAEVLGELQEKLPGLQRES
jgi:hypothetical protein